VVDGFAADILFSAGCWKSNRNERRCRMGRLEEAKGRLDRALARLEEAAGRAEREAASGSGSDVETALAATRAQRVTLETRSHEVADRLDAAIERLQAVLDEDEKNAAG